MDWDFSYWPGSKKGREKVTSSREKTQTERKKDRVPNQERSQQTTVMKKDIGMRHAPESGQCRNIFESNLFLGKLVREKSLESKAEFGIRLARNSGVIDRKMSRGVREQEMGSARRAEGKRGYTLASLHLGGG